MGMFAIAVLVALLIAVAVVLAILLRDYDTRLTDAELAKEKTFLDENGKAQQFPNLVEGTSLVDATVSLSVVVPSYNERERLPGMLDDAIATFSARSNKDSSFTWELIVVDDGS